MGIDVLTYLPTMSLGPYPTDLSAWLSSFNIVTLALVCIVFSFIYLLAYRLFLSPLSALPGPFYTCLTCLTLLYRTLTYTRTTWIHSLHLHYGPVVRLSPTEVSINTPSLASAIYSFEKPRWYDVFIGYGERNMFSSPDRAGHAWRRRLMASAYSKASVLAPEQMSMILERERRFAELIRASNGTEVGVYRLLNWVAMDISSAFLYGPEGGSDLLGDRPGERHLAVAHDLRRPVFQLRAQAPDLCAWLDWIGLGRVSKVWRIALEAGEYIEKVNMAWIGRLEKATPCMYNKLAEDESLNKTYLASEMLDHIGAGQETTAITLTYLMEHLCAHPSIQEKLHAELKAADTTSFSTIEKLPVLNAALQEALRIFTSIPASQPRVVPASGMTIGSWHIPGGTVISAQSYSLHRNTDAFPDPEVYRPERWLEADEEQLAEMNRHMIPFGRGTRGCIGQNVAMAHMKLALAAVYSEFRTRKPMVKHAEEDMTAWIDYLMLPSGLHCGIIFEKI